MSLASRLAAKLAPKKPKPAGLAQYHQVGSTLPPPLPRKPAPPAPPAVPGAQRWVSICKARQLETGLQCKLLEGHKQNHRNERGEFLRVLAPGAQPARVIDQAATRRIGANE